MQEILTNMHPLRTLRDKSLRKLERTHWHSQAYRHAWPSGPSTTQHMRCTTNADAWETLQTTATIKACKCNPRGHPHTNCKKLQGDF